jgi:hypothetical protein
MLTNVYGRELLVEGRLVRIARFAAEKYEFLGEPEAALHALRQSDVRVDIFTFMQNLADTSPKYAYSAEWDNFAALPVSTFDQWWTKQIDGKTRNMVRRSEKTLTFREVPFDAALVQGISTIYNETPIRQGVPFTHYGKDIETVGRENGTFLDRSVFVGAFLGSDIVGFAKLVSDEAGGQAGLMQIMSMVQHRDKAPTNGLIAQAVRSCAARSIPYLVYANFAYGKKQRDSLADFKENNGFQRIDVPRYYVPLTVLGRVGLQLRLHHKLIDHVPESLQGRVRKIRSLWNMRSSAAVQKSVS